MKSRSFAVDVKYFGGIALVGFSHLNLVSAHEAENFRFRIIDIADHNGLLRADVNAGGVQSMIHAMGAEIAFGRRLCVRVNVDGIIGAGLGAGSAADASLFVEIYNAVLALKQGPHRTDVHAGRIFAMITSHNGKVTSRIRKNTLFDVFYPGSVYPDGDIMFGLTRHRAGMASDAFSII